MVRPVEVIATSSRIAPIKSTAHGIRVGYHIFPWVDSLSWPGNYGATRSVSQMYPDNLSGAFSNIWNTYIKHIAGLQWVSVEYLYVRICPYKQRLSNFPPCAFSKKASIIERDKYSFISALQTHRRRVKTQEK